MLGLAVLSSAAWGQLAGNPQPAAPSCRSGFVADRLIWSDSTLGWQGSMNGSFGPHQLYTQNGVGVQATITETCGGTSWLGGTPNLFLGTLDLWIDLTNAACQVRVQFDFTANGASYPIHGLTYDIWDVDQVTSGGNNFDDRLIYDQPPSGSVTLTAGSRPTIVPPNSVHGGTECSETDARCHVRARYPNTVASDFSSIGFVYTNGPGSSGNTTGQAIEISDLRFCVNPATVPVSLASIGSTVSAEGLVVEWTTAAEAGNAGFELFGRRASGEWEPLTQELVPSVGGDSMTPQQYSVVIPDAGSLEEIALDDIDIFGISTRHGPFAVGQRFGVEDTPQPIDWKRINAELKQGAGIAGINKSAPGQADARSARLTVTEPGIQRVSFEDLLAAGVDLGGVARERIGIFDDGEPVSRYVGGAERFGPGSWIEFIGDAGVPTLYAEGNVYVVREDGAQLPAPLQPPLPDARGLEPALYTHAVVEAAQREYSFSSPVGDPWYDARLLARNGAAEVNRTLNVSAPAPGTARLEVELWGGLDWAGTEPDHHVQVLFNGTPVTEERFDGIQSRLIAVDLPTGQLNDGANTVTLRVPGDTGYKWDIVHLEAVTLTYPRFTHLDDGRLNAAVPSASNTLGGVSTFVVDGLSGDTLVGWGLRPNGKLYRNLIHGGAGKAVIPTREGENIQYWLAELGAEAKPAIAADVPAPLPAASAQYLIVTHPTLLGSEIDELVALQRGRGFNTAVVTVDSIYAAYSDHQVDAQAIRRFVAASRPNYLLLVGGDSYDYNDYLGKGSISFVPTHYVQTDEIVKYSPSDVLHGDISGNFRPDIPVGRLPVRTRAELAEMVGRLRAGARGAGGVLFVSGKSDKGREFAAATESMQAAYSRPADLEVADDIGVPSARSRTIAALSGGLEILSFHGHTSLGLWDFGGLLRNTDIASLPSGSMAGLITQWGCWNSYFVSPTSDTMAHAFLLTPGKGAAAVFGSATLTQSSSHEALAELLFSRLGTPGSTRIGDAILSAQQQLVGTKPGAVDALLGMNLLGDPAMTLSIPGETSSTGISKPPFVVVEPEITDVR